MLPDLEWRVRKEGRKERAGGEDGAGMQGTLGGWYISSRLATKREASSLFEPYGRA